MPIATAPASSGSPDALSSALRGRGLRVTSQRRDVLAAVHRLGHATAERIAAEVAGVDLTTVYRTLQLLEDLGLVAHTHLGHGAPSYRPADDAHVHVICHTCGSVLDAPADLAGELARRLRTERGFLLDVAHFTVFGLCAECLAASPSTSDDDALADRAPVGGATHGSHGREHSHGPGA